MKQQLNSAKWYLNEKIKEFQEFIKQQNEENTCNRTDTDINEQIWPDARRYRREKISRFLE